MTPYVCERAADHVYCMLQTYRTDVQNGGERGVPGERHDVELGISLH